VGVVEQGTVLGDLEHVGAIGLGEAAKLAERPIEMKVELGRRGARIRSDEIRPTRRSKAIRPVSTRSARSRSQLGRDTVVEDLQQGAHRRLVVEGAATQRDDESEDPPSRSNSGMPA
jgi:hypothetical protein